MIFKKKKEELYLKASKAGINQLELSFEFNRIDEPFTGGVMTFTPRLIENHTMVHVVRAYTQSEYDYKIERYFLYEFLWIASIPVVLVSLKSLRDIIEDK